MCIFTLPYTPYITYEYEVYFFVSSFCQKKEETKNDNRNNSQQWMSWLSQRWRTQRNAIRSVICTIREPSNLWTHIALEASAKSMPAWASVCLLTSPLLYKGMSVDLGVRSLSCIIERLGSPEKQSYVRLSHNQRGRPLRWTIVRFDSCLPKYDLDRIDFRCRNPCFFTHSSLHRKEYPKKLHLLTSVQTRLPAEFKHITKRRKRN